jgi:hypothetical protein
MQQGGRSKWQAVLFRWNKIPVRIVECESLHGCLANHVAELCALWGTCCW